MKTYDVCLILTFFDDNDEMVFRLERQYKVNSVDGRTARLTELELVRRALLKTPREQWSVATFDITIMRKGKEVAA